VRPGAEVVVAPVGEEARQGLERPGIAEGVGPPAAGRPVIGLAEHVRDAAPRNEDGRGRLRHRCLAVGGAVGKEVLAGIRIRFRDVVGVAEQVGHRLRHVAERLVIGVARLGLVDLAEPAAESVGQLGGVAVGDEAVAQGELALRVEAQQVRLCLRAELDVAGHLQVGGERRPSLRGPGQRADRGQPLEGHEVRRGLRARRERQQQAEECGTVDHRPAHDLAPICDGRARRRRPLRPVQPAAARGSADRPAE
jgi:hypothetical protein